jgi:hypothetical protein
VRRFLKADFVKTLFELLALHEVLALEGSFINKCLIFQVTIFIIYCPQGAEAQGGETHSGTKNRESDSAIQIKRIAVKLRRCYSSFSPPRRVLLKYMLQ